MIPTFLKNEGEILLALCKDHQVHADDDKDDEDDQEHLAVFVKFFVFQCFRHGPREHEIHDTIAQNQSEKYIEECAAKKGEQTCHTCHNSNPDQSVLTVQIPFLCGHLHPLFVILPQKKFSRSGRVQARKLKHEVSSILAVDPDLFPRYQKK
jgi:hypothetical protein